MSSDPTSSADVRPPTEIDDDIIFPRQLTPQLPPTTSAKSQRSVKSQRSLSTLKNGTSSVSLARQRSPPAFSYVRRKLNRSNTAPVLGEPGDLKLSSGTTQSFNDDGDGLARVQSSSMLSQWTSKDEFNVKGIKSIFARKNPFGSGLVVPRYYSVPTHCLRDIFKSLDQLDSPARPGRVHLGTMKNAISRFHSIYRPNRYDTYLDNQVEETLQTMLDQAEGQLKKGVSNPDDAMVYWEQACVFDCFQVKLPVKERIFFTFDICEQSTWASQCVSYLMMLSIFISIFTFVIDTMPEGTMAKNAWIPHLDLACVCFFTLDYFARLLTVPFARMELLNLPFLQEVIAGNQELELFTGQQRLCRFFCSFMGMVDLASVVPFWIEFWYSGGGLDASYYEGGTYEDDNFEILDLMRVFRIMRVFKIGKLASADLGEDRNMVVLLFISVIKKSFPALQLVTLLIFTALLVFGTFIWYAEMGTYFPKDSPRCPDGAELLCAQQSVRLRALGDGTYEIYPSPFDSIPISAWWVLVTITTVGYGDMYPVTPVGYFIGFFTILYGAIVFALPVGVIGTTFSQQFEMFQDEQRLRESLAEIEGEEENESQRNSIMNRLGTIADLGNTIADLGNILGGDTPGHGVPGDTRWHSGKSTRPSQELSRPVDLGPIPLVTELKHQLHQAVLQLGLPFPIFKKWSKSLLTVTKFEGLPKENPCESLEEWGRPVLVTLREHCGHHGRLPKFYQLYTMIWYRLLAQTAQAFREAEDDWDRLNFDRLLRQPLNQRPEGRKSSMFTSTSSSPRCTTTSRKEIPSGTGYSSEPLATTIQNESREISESGLIEPLQRDVGPSKSCTPAFSQGFSQYLEGDAAASKREKWTVL